MYHIRIIKDAKEICRQYGLLDDEINSLTRWEIIDVIRNLSTQVLHQLFSVK